MPLLIAALLLSAPATQLDVDVRGSIEASLAGPAGADGSALAAQVARLLRWRGDVVKNVHPGDRMHVLYESTPQGPELLAVEYKGSELSLRAYRYTDRDGIARYYDHEGGLIEPAIKRSPVAAYVQITETPQHGRGKRRHQGLDLKAPEGTPITMPFAGRVLRTNWSRRVNGNCIEVQFDSGKLGRFLHLSSIGRGVEPGARLEAGEALGTVGNTGRSSAPHLHYEVREADGTVLDPLRIHGTTTAAVPEESLAAFHTVRELFDRLLADRTLAVAPKL